MPAQGCINALQVMQKDYDPLPGENAVMENNQATRTWREQTTQNKSGGLLVVFSR